MNVTTELYLMSPPGPNWALRGRSNFRSENAAQVDPIKARAEWDSLADSIESRGGVVVCLEPPHDTALTGLPYAAECGQVVEFQGQWVFLLPRMASPHRQGERLLWGPLANALGWRTIDVAEACDEPNAIWEAQGDVARFRDTTLLFYGGRTTRGAALAASRYFSQPVELIEIRQPAFHGNMAALPLEAIDRLVVCRSVLVGEGWQRLVDRFGLESMIEVSEDEIRSYATNGLPIGRDLIVPHLVPDRVRHALTSLGMRMVELSMTELCEKAGGASRCLVSHVSVPGRFDVPARYRRAYRP